MTPEQFTYWMQGFAELNTEPPTAAQWRSMREHLALVFQKRTPPLAPHLQWPNDNPTIAVPRAMSYTTC